VDNPSLRRATRRKNGNSLPSKASVRNDGRKRKNVVLESDFDSGKHPNH
jgi:hypothetical protein